MIQLVCMPYPAYSTLFQQEKLFLQVDLVTAHLASAHIPLAILVFGLQTDLQTPAAKQVCSYHVGKDGVFRET